MNASYAGSIAGINGRPMAAAEASAALEAALANRMEEVGAREKALLTAGSDPSSEDEATALKPLTWYDMCHCTASAVALMMVRDLLHPTKATVVFNRVFDQEAGGTLQPSWSLGHYLAMQPPQVAVARQAEEEG